MLASKLDETLGGADSISDQCKLAFCIKRMTTKSSLEGGVSTTDPVERHPAQPARQTDLKQTRKDGGSAEMLERKAMLGAP